MVSACLNNAPLTESDSCDLNSSEDYENSEKLSLEEQSKMLAELNLQIEEERQARLQLERDKMKQKVDKLPTNHFAN